MRGREPIEYEVARRLETRPPDFRFNAAGPETEYHDVTAIPCVGGLPGETPMLTEPHDSRPRHWSKALRRRVAASRRPTPRTAALPGSGTAEGRVSR